MSELRNRWRGWSSVARDGIVSLSSLVMTDWPWVSRELKKIEKEKKKKKREKKEEEMERRKRGNERGMRGKRKKKVDPEKGKKMKRK